MEQNNSGNDEVNNLTESLDLPYQVRISEDLSEQLKPNAFISGLGVQYLERIKTILGIVKANMILKQNTQEVVFSKQGSVVIPLTLAKGPYIREELISIKAEVADDGGEKVISLTSILEED